MWSSNFIQGLPSRGNQDDGHSTSAAPPDRTSENQDLEHTPPIVTSDILHPSRSLVESPRLSTNGHLMADRLSQQALKLTRPQAESQQSASPAPTPRSSRLEVVLNLSPYKKFSGHQAYDEVDLEDDELVASDLTSRKRPRISQTSSVPRHAAPVTKASAPPGIKRPRGRPKGWKPGMPSTKTGLPTASSHKYLDADGNPIVAIKSVSVPKDTGVKRRGRPPRPPSPTARNIWDTMTPPKYLRFQCEWDKCCAELQNAKTLRKHIRVVHGLSAPLMCRWAKCGKANQPLIFTQESDFQKHVDTVHMMPYVWLCGDGPSNSRCVVSKKRDRSQDEIPEYLLGPDGEQVTPSVRDQVKEDALTYRENRRRLKRILFQRDANAPSEEEENDGEAGELISS